MQSKYVTWYGHHHLVPLISPKYCHDLHCYRHDTMICIILIFYQCVVTWSSRQLLLLQLLLLQLLLSHSDKVKQLYGACILCNKEITIRLLPVADNFNKTWSSHTIKFSIMSSTLLLQVLRGCYGLSKNRSYLRIKTTTFFREVCDVLTFNKDRA